MHVVVINSTRWNQYIGFRDALRQDLSLANEYRELKTAIVEKHPEGRAKYSELKSVFISRVLEQIPSA
ncbi:MAG: GrpB family protein [Granulosicoccus sp.]